VCASFTIAWKHARAKTPDAAGKSLVKPAAAKIARITCCGAEAQGGCNQAPLPDHT